MFGHGQVFVRLRAPLVPDPYSNDSTRRDWTAAVETQLPGFGIDPGGSAVVDSVNRSVVTTEPTLIWSGPDIPDVALDDRIRTPDGRLWRVDGHPSIPVHPMTGWRPGATWPLKVVEG